MSKNPSRDLFDLIKSLTKSEKRLFKLYAARYSASGNNKYVDLFDAIDNQTEYDEEEVMSSTPSLKESDLVSMKGYLFSLVLRSLRDSVKEDSVELWLNVQLDHARLLIGKRLFRSASKILARAKKVAEERELFLPLIEIIKNEGRASPEKNGALLIEAESVLGKLQEFLAYQRLLNGMYEMRGEFPIQQPTKLDTIVNDPLMKSDAKQQSIRSELLYRSIRFYHAFFKQDPVESNVHAWSIIRLLEDYPVHRESNRKQYRLAITNLLKISILFRNEVDYNYLLPKLHELENEQRSTKFGPLTKGHRLSAEMLRATRWACFDEGLNLIPEAEDFLARHSNEVPPEICNQLRLEIGMLYLIIGDFHRSQTWMHTVLATKNVGRDPFSYLRAKLLNLVNYYELGEIDLLESSVRSSQRFLKKNDRLRGGEQALFSAFKRSLKVRSGKKQMLLYKECYDEIKQTWVRPTKDGQEMRDQFDIESWLKSKLTKRPFAEVLMERERRLTKL